MRLSLSFWSALFVLVLAGLPVGAQGLKLSRSPRELGVAVLRELSVGEGQLRFRVDSNGCTDAGSFKVRSSRQEGAGPKRPHYLLTVERVRADECKALLLEGVEIEIDLAKDLGLKGRYTVSVANPVLADLLAATLRAVELEIGATRRKLEAAEGGAERFQRKLRDLEAERARFAGLQPEQYPAPEEKPADPGSILESSADFGPVLPPAIREVIARPDGPLAEGALLPVEGTSKSGPFYHLAGVAGGDYGLLKPGNSYRLRLRLVYRREYFGLIGDYYVYILSAR